MTAAWPGAAATLAAVGCAGLMGFAIQRGGTCTVAAVDELLHQRRALRLLAMLEASLWVAGGLALAQWAGLPQARPAGHAAGVWTAVGGAVLGLGGWVNRACVFGAVARLGSGEWAYAATPAGYFAGCLSVMPVFMRPLASTGAGTVALPMPLLFALAFVAWALWRTVPALWSWSRRRVDGAALAQRVWAPHAATIVIGLSFVATLLLAGRWAYTDVLADLASAMGGAAAMLGWPVLLLAALYAGALAGGLTAGRWKPARPAPATVLRCFAGGVLMAWGSLLIPGSNDGLVLVGLPLLQPHAWLAFAAMVLAIAVAMLLARTLRRVPP